MEEENQQHQRSEKLIRVVLSELKVQQAIAFPLVAMNIALVSKQIITTVFLGRLGALELASGTLGFMFANVTGFSILYGLCGAMEPICGQAYGAKNFKLLHKNLVMMFSLLLLTSIFSCLLWLNVDKILISFGQQEDISVEAKKYLFYLLPDLVITSFLSPLKSYLSLQNKIIPIMFSWTLAVVLHVPINIFLSKTRGFEGVAMAIWITDLIAVVLLAVSVVVVEFKKGGAWKEGGWCEQRFKDWVQMLKLCGPCCVVYCLESWCYEILTLLSGKLPNARQAISIIAIVFNFEYMVYGGVILALATSASIRVSNELGANHARPAYRAAYVSLSLGLVVGLAGGVVTVLARGLWGRMFSHDKAIVRGTGNAMLWLGLLVVVNFPLAISCGILRGTARPLLGIYANTTGFCLLALPLGVLLAFRVHLGLQGLLIGMVAGVSGAVILLLVFISRISWAEEANKAQKLAAVELVNDENENIVRA